MDKILGYYCNCTAEKLSGSLGIHIDKAEAVASLIFIPMCLELAVIDNFLTILTLGCFSLDKICKKIIKSSNKKYE